MQAKDVRHWLPRVYLHDILKYKLVASTLVGRLNVNIHTSEKSKGLIALVPQLTGRCPIRQVYCHSSQCSLLSSSHYSSVSLAFIQSYK